MVNPKLEYTPNAIPAKVMSKICKKKIKATIPTNIKLLVIPAKMLI